MNWKVDVTDDFLRQAKKLAKKCRSLRQDLQSFRESITQNPFQGAELTNGIRKIRMPIDSKGGGKSNGARIITLTYYIDDETGQFVLMLIYDYNQADTVDKNIVKILAKQLGYDVDRLNDEDRLR